MTEQSSRTGTIIKGVGGAYWIYTDEKDTVTATLRGIFRKDKVVPTIGDRVTLSLSGDPDIPYVIDSILPRRNLLLRPSVANIDELIITISCMDPPPDLGLLDKLLIFCSVADIEPLIMMTKTDLNREAASSIAAVYRRAGFTVYSSGIGDTADLRSLRDRLLGKTAGFAGQSGVGKSTLVNLLSGFTGMEVGDISERLHRGKHTTRHVEIIPLEGLFLFDTPGFSMLEITQMGIEETQVASGYPEILRASTNCRFQDCLHVGELGCSVETTDIDAGRLERYREFVNIIRKSNPYNKKRGRHST